MSADAFERYAAKLLKYVQDQQAHNASDGWIIDGLVIRLRDKGEYPGTLMADAVLGERVRELVKESSQ